MLRNRGGVGEARKNPSSSAVEPLSVLDPCCSYVSEKKEVDAIGDVLRGKCGSEGGSVLGTMSMGLARVGGGGHSGSEVTP
mmetsp:Transcript_32192/g.54401  ORF Transcript_32192/g.54401 Transcript_32192/m.54401 type:complete len:81 (-) Transcript_32192:69-311(-)